MEMTAWEICREYRQAQYKDEQVMILAELNLCSKSDIIKVLSECGIEHNPEKKRRGAKPKAVVKITRGLPRLEYLVDCLKRGVFPDETNWKNSRNVRGLHNR